MTIFELLSWDAFGSGWFWSLLLMQWFAHALWVMGIPVDMLRGSDMARLDLIIDWRKARLIEFVQGLNIILVIAVSCVVSILVVFGFWYKIETFLAVCLLILPELVIFWLCYNTAIMLSKLNALDHSKLNYINVLHYKIYVVGGVTFLMAGIFGYGYEVLQ